MHLQAIHLTEILLDLGTGLQVALVLQGSFAAAESGLRELPFYTAARLDCIVDL